MGGDSKVILPAPPVHEWANTFPSHSLQPGVIPKWIHYRCYLAMVVVVVGQSLEIFRA